MLLTNNDFVTYRGVPQREPQKEPPQLRPETDLLMNQTINNHHGRFFETKLTKWTDFREKRFHVQTNYII
jgi:hypothetical protein